MSSPAGIHCSQTHLLARWLPSSSRAGVILNPCSNIDAPVGQRSLCSLTSGLNDSFSHHFSPLPASADSSCGEVEPLSVQAQTELEEMNCEHPSDEGDVVDGFMEMAAQSHDLSLVMKLEQLRQWQQHMQEQLRAQQLQELLRLQQEQHELLEELTTPPQDREGFGEWNQTGLSKISAQEPKPQDSSTHEETSGGDRPIKVISAGQKTFEELLEEQLRLEEKRLKSLQQPQSDPGCGVPLGHPKRAFLKKGDGLLRFTGRKVANKDLKLLPQPNAIIRSNSEPISLLQGQTSNAHKRQVQRKTISVCKDFPSTSSLRQNKNTVRLKIQNHLQHHIPQSDSERFLERQANMPSAETTTPTGGSIHGEINQQAESSQSGQVYNSPKPEPSAQKEGEARDSMERSFQERLLHWETVWQQERVELGEFELLEQAAEELSFSSNSSFVLKVLQMDQQRQLHQRRLSSTPIKPVLDPRDPFKEKSHKHAVCENEVNQADKHGPSVPSVFTFPSQSNPPYDKCTYEDANSCQELSEAASYKSGDSTMTEEQPEQEGHPSELQFDDHDTWSQLSDSHSLRTASPDEPASPVKNAVARKVAVSKAVEVEKQPTGSTSSELINTLFPTLYHNAPVNHRSGTMEPQSIPDSIHAQQAQSQLLRDRLVELEAEIERFKKENAALVKLQKDNQKLQDDLRRERCEFEQMKAQEMSRFEECKREENRKLQKERKLLEKHMSAARAIPNKSERQEIQALKQELNSLLEELKRKESCWANTHSRQRHQLETLEQDNRALREEVKTLEKLRIKAWKKTSEDSDKSSAPKGVKFATPLDTSSSPQNSPPTPTVREIRRASAPGAAAVPTGMKSSLRTPTLTGRTTEESEEQSQSSLSLPETQGCSLGDTQPVPDCESRLPASMEEAAGAEGKVKQLLPNGARLIVFPNGTKKEVSPNGRTVKVTFFNGDTKELTADQREIYYYAEARTTHITYPDGMEILQFPNNQTEKHFPNGHKEITFPDLTVKTLYPNGREESVLTDGTIIHVHPDGSKEIHFTTGQREVHTAEYKRREYPDGTVKTVYSDGRQETSYPTGRLRIKDREGNVILDNRA